MKALNSQKKPKLRFPEFSSQWDAEYIQDLLSESLTNGAMFNKENFNGDVFNAFIVQLKDIYNSETEVNCQALEKVNTNTYNRVLLEGDLLINRVSINPQGVGKVVIAIKISENEPTLFESNMFRVRFKKNELVAFFFIYYSQTNSYLRQKFAYAKTTNQSSLSQGDLCSIKINLPDLEEQQKIANFLSSIDKKIQQLTEKQSLLQQYKKGIMQKLFSQEIRFKDEQGNDFPDWDSVKLSDILELQDNAIDMADEKEYELITVRRRNGGVDSRGRFKGKEVLVKNQFKLNSKQFVISKRQIVHGACGLVPEHLEGAIVSNEYNVFEPVESKLDIEYFNIFATTLLMRKAFFINSDGVHIEKLLFKTRSWLKTKILLPNKNEQQKIVSFMSVLDKKIEFVSQQIEQTKTFKKGLLQQMFV